MHGAMNFLTPRFLLGLTLSLPACRALLAYEAPLTSAALHEAYVLGQRNDQMTAAFLSPYLKQITEGPQAPHITEIEILTPFAQVVDLSRSFTAGGYPEELAVREYHQRGDTVVVRIVLMLPAAFPKAEPTAAQSSIIPQQAPPPNATLRPENFWQNFRFETKQRGKTIATRSVHNKSIYSTPTKDTPAVLDGATVWLEYDAKDVASEEIVVEATTPDSKKINLTFDLKKLR
jgi:hypothetical protein